MCLSLCVSISLGHLRTGGRRQLSLHIRQICLGSARSQRNQGFGNCPSINDRNVTLRNCLLISFLWGHTVPSAVSVALSFSTGRREGWSGNCPSINDRKRNGLSRSSTSFNKLAVQNARARIGHLPRCSSVGRAPALGAGSQRFEPSHRDQIPYLHAIGRVAQWTERLAVNQWVDGSNPSFAANSLGQTNCPSINERKPTVSFGCVELT